MKITVTLREFVCFCVCLRQWFPQSDLQSMALAFLRKWKHACLFCERWLFPECGILLPASSLQLMWSPPPPVPNTSHALYLVKTRFVSPGELLNYWAKCASSTKLTPNVLMLRSNWCVKYVTHHTAQGSYLNLWFSQQPCRHKWHSCFLFM